MILNCAIIDDEPLAAELLAGYANKTPFLNLIGTYNSAVSAIRELKLNPVDIIFLDIQMSELSGIEFARILPRETKIIFTTAFDQYAVEAYKVNAIDYLLKPVSYNEFVKSVNKAIDYFSTVYKKEAYEKDRFMFVKSDYKLQRVAFDDILYIEGLKDYIRIYLENGQRIMSLMNMKNLEDFLPSPNFMRTHRSYIVNMSKITVIDKFRIIFGNTQIPISDSYKEAVQSYFDKYTLS